MSPIM